MLLETFRSYTVTLIYLGAKCCAEQIDSRTVIFYQWTWKQPQTITLNLPSTTELNSTLNISRFNLLIPLNTLLLLNRPLSTYSDIFTEHSICSTTSKPATLYSTLCTLNPASRTPQIILEHIQHTTELLEDTTMTLEVIIVQEDQVLCRY